MGARWSSGGPCVSVTLSDLDRGRLFFTPLAFWAVGLRHIVPKLTFKKHSRNTQQPIVGNVRCFIREKSEGETSWTIFTLKKFLFLLTNFIKKMFFRRSGGVFWRRMTESGLIQGFLWVFMGFYGFSWVFMGFHGFRWVSMGFHGFLMGFDGFRWVLMGFDGFWCWEWDGTMFWPEKNMRKQTSIEMFRSIPSSFWQKNTRVFDKQERITSSCLWTCLVQRLWLWLWLVSRASHEKNHHLYGIIYGYGRGAGSRLERAHVGVIVKLGSI